MNDIVKDMRVWRQDIHKHPELGFNEERTSAKVAKILKDLNIEIHVSIGGTGVVGVIKKGSSGRAIGLRADMDALPIQEKGETDYKSVHDGVFHGCGHDGHTAMLLGAAAKLAAEKFDGTVYLVFQPSEENGKGALAMIEDGLFERFPMDAIYGLHNMPGIKQGKFAIKSGQMMTSEDIFEIEIAGKGGHASMPHMTRDPMIAGAEIVTALQSIVSRSIGPDEWGVVSVTEFITDGARNIIPSNVIIKGDARALDPAVQKKIEQRMRDIVDGVCKSHNVSGSVVYRNDFIVLDNSEAETKAAVEAAKMTVGENMVDGSCAICTCSEDFAQFLNHIPGCFILLGAGDGDNSPPLHNPYYDYNDALLESGSDYWVNLVRSQLG
jgi:amidohydrolase